MKVFQKQVLKAPHTSLHGFTGPGAQPRAAPCQHSFLQDKRQTTAVPSRLVTQHANSKDGASARHSSSRSSNGGSSSGRSSVLGGLLPWALLGGFKQQLPAAASTDEQQGQDLMHTPLPLPLSSAQHHQQEQHDTVRQARTSVSGLDPAPATGNKHDKQQHQQQQDRDEEEAQVLLTQLTHKLRALQHTPTKASSINSMDNSGHSSTSTGNGAAADAAPADGGQAAPPQPAAAAAADAAELLLQLRGCFADATAWQGLVDDFEQAAARALQKQQQLQAQQQQQEQQQQGHAEDVDDAATLLPRSPLTPAVEDAASQAESAASEQQQKQQQQHAASIQPPPLFSVTGRHWSTPVVVPSLLATPLPAGQQQQQVRRQQHQQPLRRTGVVSRSGEAAPRSAAFEWSSSFDSIQQQQQQQQQRHRPQSPLQYHQQLDVQPAAPQPVMQPATAHPTNGTSSSSPALTSSSSITMNSSDSSSSGTTSSSRSMKYEWLVFGGGGARCFAYAGALHALKQLGLLGRLKGVSGSSGGAVYALLAALDFSIAEVQAAMSALPSESELSWLGLNKRLGLSDGAALFNQIEAAIASKLGKSSPTLGDVAAAAGCHVSLAATSLARRAPVYLSSSSHPDMLVRDALRASCAIPFFFTPVRDAASQDLLVDGCISDCTPLAGLSLAGGASVDPSKTLVLAVHDAGGMESPDFQPPYDHPLVAVQGLLTGLISTCMQAGFHHTLSAGIDLLNLWPAVAAVNPLQFRLEQDAARQVISTSQALAEAFAASKMRQRETAGAAADSGISAMLSHRQHTHHHHHTHTHTHTPGHSSQQQGCLLPPKQEQQQQQYRWSGSVDEDWQAEELSGVWGVDDSMADDDDEPLSAWWRSHLQQQQQQEQQQRQQQQVELPALPGLLRPVGMSDEDWSLVQAVAEQQERLLLKQQQEGPEVGLQDSQTAGAAGGGSGEQCVLMGAGGLDQALSALGGGLEFIVVEQEGISRVCLVLSSTASPSSSDDEEGGAVMMGSQDNGAGRGVEGFVKAAAMVAVGGSARGAALSAGFDADARDHPVVLHSMQTMDESVLHG